MKVSIITISFNAMVTIEKTLRAVVKTFRVLNK